MRKFRMKPVTAAIGAAFVASLATASFADTAANPFGADELAIGYDLLAGSPEGETKDGEGTCGESKDAEGKCGEGKCGEGQCGEATGDEPPDDEAQSDEAST